MASWRQSFVMRSSPGTRRPKKTRPCRCPRPANQRTWTPSSWSHWSRRLSQPSWPASITLLSLRGERVKLTHWWPQPTAWTTCVAWTRPGTPGSEKPQSRGGSDTNEEYERSWMKCRARKGFFFLLKLIMYLEKNGHRLLTWEKVALYCNISLTDSFKWSTLAQFAKWNQAETKVLTVTLVVWSGLASILYSHILTKRVFLWKHNFSFNLFIFITKWQGLYVWCQFSFSFFF